MTDEEKARQKTRCYDTEYSEDFMMSDMLSRPQDFDKRSIKDVYLCLKEKHYRDGYADGIVEGQKRICEQILNEIDNHKEHNNKLNYEQFSYIFDIIKSLGVDV